jgi:hypothetical protein
MENETRPDQSEESDQSEHENQIKMVAYLLILLALFLVCASSCDPNGDLPAPATKPRKGHA